MAELGPGLAITHYGNARRDPNYLTTPIISLPGLVGRVELDNVGHWVQHEASAEVSKQLVQFLRTVRPA